MFYKDMIENSVESAETNMQRERERERASETDRSGEREGGGGDKRLDKDGRRRERE